jgi:hypothetical protein
MRGEGAPSVSTQSYRYLRSTKHEKHFKVSHKVEVLARIYFSITRIK